MTSETAWKPSTDGELDAWGRGYLTGWERGYADALEALGIDTSPGPVEGATAASNAKED